MEIGKIEKEWMVLEQMLRKEHAGNKMTIGLPLEQNPNESRIVLTPSVVNRLVEQGCTVIVERNLGSHTRFSNHDFAEAGATMTSSHSEAFFTDVVIRVSPPDMGEMELMKPQATLISSIVGALKDERYIRQLLNNKITAISFEHIQTANGEFPLLNLLRDIAGHLSIAVAANLLSDAFFGQGRALSGFAGIPPAEILILGANAASVAAAKTAIGMGAEVKILARNFMEINAAIKNLTVPVHTDILNIKSIQDALIKADVVISTLSFIDTIPDFFIPAEMVAKMQKGSVIIDLSVDSGGTFETSQLTTLETPYYQSNGITHYGVPNITAMTPNTTSLAFSNFLEPALLRLISEGGIDNFLRSDVPWSNGVYVYKGYSTNLNISKLHNIPFKEIDLLMAIFNK